MFAEEFIVFKTVAETSNITLAARRLHISQPAISLQIQNIENYYGAKFFVRSNKGVQLTAAGKIFYKFVCNMLEMLDAVRQEIGKLSGDCRCEVRLGAAFTIGDYVLPGLLTYLAKDRPNTNFLVSMANTKTIVQEVFERKVRIGLIEGPVVEAFGLLVEGFWQDELKVVVPCDHPWVESGAVSLQELAGTRLILREKGSGTRKSFERFLIHQGLSPADFNVVMELGSMHAINKVVAAGLGVTVVSDLAISGEEGLCALRVQGLEMKREFSIVTNPANSALSDEELFFVDVLRDRQLLDKVLG